MKYRFQLSRSILLHDEYLADMYLAADTYAIKHGIQITVHITKINRIWKWTHFLLRIAIYM